MDHSLLTSPDTTMRTGLVGALALLALLLAPGAASAQAGSLDVRVVRIEGPGGVRDTNEEVVNGVNAADCAAPEDTEITFQVTQGSPTNQYDLWVALVNDCEATSTRSGTTQTCFDINREISLLETNNTFVLTLDELIVGTEGDFDRNPCEEIWSPQGGNYFLHVYDSASSSTTGELGSIPRGVASIAFDVKAPNPPEMTSGDVSGENVAVSWNAGEGDSDAMQYTFEVYDVGSCAAGGQDGGGGGTPDGGASDGGVSGSLIRTVSQGTASIRIDTADLGLGMNEGAAIAVLAIDPAGNRSELSSSVCVTNVPSAGFCDVYGEMGGECGTCSVAAPGSARGVPVAGLAGLAVAVGLVVDRSRRRQRTGRTRA